MGSLESARGNNAPPAPGAGWPLPPAAEDIHRCRCCSGMTGQGSSDQVKWPHSQPQILAASLCRLQKLEAECAQLRNENGWLRGHLQDTQAQLQRAEEAEQQAAAARMSVLHQLQQAVDAEHLAKKQAVKAQVELSGQLDAALQAAANWQAQAAELRLQLAQAQANVARLEQELLQRKPCFGRSARLCRNCLPGLRLVVHHRHASSTLVALPQCYQCGRPAAGLLLGNAAAAWSAAMSNRPLPPFCRPPRCIHGRAALVLWLALSPDRWVRCSAFAAAARLQLVPGLQAVLACVCQRHCPVLCRTCWRQRISAVPRCASPCCAPLRTARHTDQRSTVPHPLHTPLTPPFAHPSHPTLCTPLLSSHPPQCPAKFHCRGSPPQRAQDSSWVRRQ